MCGFLLYFSDLRVFTIVSASLCQLDWFLFVLIPHCLPRNKGFYYELSHLHEYAVQPSGWCSQYIGIWTEQRHEVREKIKSKKVFIGLWLFYTRPGYMFRLIIENTPTSQTRVHLRKLSCKCGKLSDWRRVPRCMHKPASEQINRQYKSLFLQLDRI